MQAIPTGICRQGFSTYRIFFPSLLASYCNQVHNSTTLNPQFATLMWRNVGLMWTYCGFGSNVNRIYTESIGHLTQYLPGIFYNRQNKTRLIALTLPNIFS